MNKVKQWILNNNFLTGELEKGYCFLPRLFGQGRAFPPLSAVLLISYRCNLHCQMCFYYNQKTKNKTISLINEQRQKELSLDEIKKLIRDLIQLKIKFLTIHGGEPLLYPKIKEVIEEANRIGLIVRFVSNGTLINSEKAEMIVKNKIEHITFSLDGPEKIHDKIRGVPNTFSRLMRGVALIQAAKSKVKSSFPNLNFGCTITALNQNHLVEIIEIAHQINIPKVTFILATYNEKKLSAKTSLILTNTIKKSENDPGDLNDVGQEIGKINIKTLKEQRRKIIELAKKYEIEVWFPTEEMIEKYVDLSFNQEKTCSYPWRRVVISPYGDVYPCINVSFLNYSMGNVKEKKLKEIWNNQVYCDFRKKLKKYQLFPICAKCCFVNLGKRL